MEAIILAGGFGTRLNTILRDIPKPMAQVNGKPFLKYVFDYLLKNGIHRVVLAVGYKADVIQEHFKNNYKGIDIIYSVEDTPLGTGGAIKKAMERCNDEEVFVLNGDTYFDVDLSLMQKFHKRKKSRLTIAVKPMSDFERYGTVMTENDIIKCFEEKKRVLKGKINGGIYLVQKNILASIKQKAFSFEKDFLENSELKIYAFNSEGYFIDIGIPDDYARAQKEFIDM